MIAYKVNGKKRLHAHSFGTAQVENVLTSAQNLRSAHGFMNLLHTRSDTRGKRERVQVRNRKICEFSHRPSWTHSHRPHTFSSNNRFTRDSFTSITHNCALRLTTFSSFQTGSTQFMFKKKLIIHEPLCYTIYLWRVILISLVSFPDTSNVDSSTCNRSLYFTAAGRSSIYLRNKSHKPLCT